MAGGTAVLGGVVAGPAIAITGFVIASKAEEALTKAREYESQADEAIAKIDIMKIALQGLQTNTREMERTIIKLANVFDKCKPEVECGWDEAFERMLVVGKALKEVLDTPILESDGSAVKNLKSKLNIVTSGLIEYEG